MSSVKPTIILVPGAWHTPDCYQPTTKLLKEYGHNVIGVELPSVGADPPLKSWDQDVVAIRHAVTSVVDAGRDVVLVLHSYGALPAQEACQGMAKKDLHSQGKTGGVTRLVYLNGFIADVGFYLLGFSHDQPMPWFDLKGDFVFPINAEEIFYNDLPADQAMHWASRLKQHSYPTMSSKITYAAWKDIPSAYLLCENDNAVPLPAQEAMVAGAKAKGAEFIVEKCASGHSPFLSMPETTAAFISKVAGEGRFLN